MLAIAVPSCAVPLARLQPPPPPPPGVGVGDTIGDGVGDTIGDGVGDGVGVGVGAGGGAAAPIELSRGTPSKSVGGNAASHTIVFLSPNTLHSDAALRR